MSFILGNQAVLSAFESSAKTGRLSHAYIIEGAMGSGRLTLARAISATLACSCDKPCFKCNSCQKIMQGIHQDVKEIKCEEDSNVIKIDAIREVIKDAYIKPAESERRIFIIENAQQMGIPAQNALLQTFEEPPKNVIFFLLVTNRNLLLSTLKSRAVTLKTEKFSDEFIKSELLRRYPSSNELIDEAMLIADGALGKALEFLENEDGRRAITLVKSYFKALETRGTYVTLSYILSADIKNDKNELFAVMNCFSIALRDIITYSSGYEGRAMFFVDKKLLKALADRLKTEKLLKAYDTVCRITEDANKINVTLALANLNMALCDDFS